MISSLIFKASKTAGLREISEALLDEMNRRFEFMLDIRHPNFDPIFLLATALDPNLKIFVSVERQQIIRSRFIGIMDQLVIHFSTLNFLKVILISQLTEYFDFLTFHFSGSSRSP